MAGAKEPDCLKFISPTLKTGKEFAKRDPVITYYCNVYSLQKALSTLGKKRPKEADMFLLGMMDQVEQMKKQLAGDEAVSSEVVGQAHVESKALQLFTYADNEDRAGRFGKNVVKAFYTAHILFEVVAQFGEQSTEVMEKQKYARWKAAYISRCLKDGQTPIAGPVGGDEEEGGDMATGGAAAYQPPGAAAAAYGGAQAPAPGFGQPAPGFGGFDMGGMGAGGDPNDIPGFVQPMNPMASFVPPTNPASTFNQEPYPPFNQAPGSGGFGPAPGAGGFAQQPGAQYPPPTSTQAAPSYDMSAAAAAAANAAAMSSLQQPQARSQTPTASPGGSLRPTPAPRQADYAGKILPVPTGGDFKTLDYTQKSRLEKLLKFASSALMYDDMSTVAQNLTRAHNLVVHGKEE